MVKVRLMALAAALFVLPLSSSAEQVGVDGSDTKFETTITETIGGQQVTLDLTGVALREKAWFNVYAVGSYLQQGAAAKTADELAAADVPKKLHLVMEREVDGKKMSDAFKEGIEANYSASDFAAELKSFEDYFAANSVAKGDVISFVNEPGVGLIAQVAKAEALSIKNPKFSKAVWDIYFGSKNISGDIKTALSSRLK